MWLCDYLHGYWEVDVVTGYYYDWGRSWLTIQLPIEGKGMWILDI